MKVKQKSIILAAFIVFASSLTAGMFTSSPVNALTDEEVQACADEWGGRSTGSSDSQALSDQDIEDFEASKCAKGSNPACSLEKQRRSDVRYINCRTAGDGEDVAPGVDIVASQIKRNNYEDYTNQKIQNECKKHFPNNETKRDKCIGQAKERRNELRREYGEPAEPAADRGTDACDVETSILPVDCSKGNNPIWGLLLLVVNILTAGVGIVAVGGIIYAALLWTTAEDKNAQIVKSKEVIFNVVLGMAAFALLYAFLQFLIPGGVFN